MANIIDKIKKNKLSNDIPKFRVGTLYVLTIRSLKEKEERIQAFEGVVVAKRNGSVSETFTVRKISSGVGVERIFPVNSPKIDKVVVVRKGKVRRAKLTFLKNYVGQYKIKERGQKVSKKEEDKKAA